MAARGMARDSGNRFGASPEWYTRPGRLPRIVHHFPGRQRFMHSRRHTCAELAAQAEAPVSRQVLSRRAFAPPPAMICHAPNATPQRKTDRHQRRRSGWAAHSQLLLPIAVPILYYSADPLTLGPVREHRPSESVLQADAGFYATC